MSKQREAMKQALHALQTKGEHHRFVYDAMKALAEALAEPEPWTPDDMAYRPGGLSMSAEQEPVAWMMVNEEHGHKPTLHWKPQEDWHITWKAVPLYTAPPARKPLTDEEINSLADKVAKEMVILPVMNFSVWLARAIERAHGIGEA